MAKTHISQPMSYKMYKVVILHKRFYIETDVQMFAPLKSTSDDFTYFPNIDVVKIFT